MKCPRCGGSVIRNMAKEVSCLSCGHVLEEGEPMPSLFDLGATIPNSSVMRLKQQYNLLQKEEDELKSPLL